MEHWQGNRSYCSDGELHSNVSIMQSFYGDAGDSWWPTSHKIDYQCYLGEDVAIRQYCAAARLECSLQSCDEMDTGLLSTSDSSDSPLLDLAEEDEMIESFINMDDDDHESCEFDDESKSRVSEEKIVRFKDERFPSVLQDVVEIGTSSERRVKPPGSGEIDQGLHLVHLLLACAEAVGCRDSQLAAKVLQQIWKSAHPCGDALQRVTCCFAKGLTSRLLLLLQNNSNSCGTNLSTLQPPGGSDLMRAPTKAERVEGFQLLYQCTPYIAFGFMAANEAIAQATEGKKAIHILDLGMVQALQWPALMRKLAARAEGAPSVRLTGMGTCSYSEIQEWGAALGKEAKALGLGFEFRGIVEPVTPNLLDPTFLNLRPGETLIINSVLCLHKFVNESRGSLRSILQALQRLNPCILTLVEQDANHNGPFFLGRFLESLHYYSAIFDSLEASLPRSSPQRMKVERFHFAEEIGNIVAYEAAERVERHERADQWRRQLGRSGFQGFPLRFMSQARMMLSVYGCDGYSLAEDKGCLLLGWKGRPIMLASVWRPNNHSHY
ncbi:hypothetical protein SUGI_0394040 [Cryptomeria japonica]|nr:hypothetical protein SUGI_0394040 [Cryptomeria japonica]